MTFNPATVATILLDNPDSRETMLGLLSKTQIKAVDAAVDKIRDDRNAAARTAAFDAALVKVEKQTGDLSDPDIDRAIVDAAFDLASLVASFCPAKGSEGGWMGYSLNPGIPTPFGSLKVILTTSTK